MNCKCPHCAANASLYLETTDLNHQISTSVFDYYLCEKCSLIFIHPIPPNLSKYYETTYPPYRIPGTLIELKAAARHVNWRVSLVQQYASNGKILEIGASYGAFAYAAIQSGFLVDAIEMDSSCCEFINNNIVGAKAIHTNDVIEGMSLLEDKYEVVALWHNLEHLVDPWTVLEESVKYITSNGILVISTPNPDSLQFKLFKKYWVHLDAPRHLALIPRATLTKFLSERGMKLELVTTTDPDGLSLNKMGWGGSLTHVFRTTQGNLLRKICSNLLNILMMPIERWGQLGTAYTVIYKKM